jgi:hypothetical protein
MIIGYLILVAGIGTIAFFQAEGYWILFIASTYF